MLSATPVHAPFSAEGHLGGPSPGVIPNPDSDSSEVHNLGRQLCRLFSWLCRISPTKRAYGPEQTGVLFRGNGRLVPSKRAAAYVLCILGEMDVRKCRHEVPGSEETGVPSECSRIPHRTGVVAGHAP